MGTLKYILTYSPKTTGVVPALLLYTLLLAVLAPFTLKAAEIKPDSWVNAFYATPDPKERRTIVDSQDFSDMSFDQLYDLLANPPSKLNKVKTGTTKTYRKDDRGKKFYYALDIPDNYNPSHAYPLIVYLHGGVSRNKPKLSQVKWRMHEQLETDDAIQVFPVAWDKAKWWSQTQTDNLHGIIAQLKASYSIDTNKVFLIGVSDGATGGFNIAATTPSEFAGFVSVIGYPGVLKNRRVRLAENIYPINMRAIKIIAFNTNNDQLYPLEQMRVFTNGFKDIGVDIELVAYPDGGHSMKTLTRSLPHIREFIAITSRDSYPDKITWQYEDGSQLHRVNWLTIHELMPNQGIKLPSGLNPTNKHSGMIELVKTGNTIVIQNHGVKSYSLLLSPAHFDFKQPVTLIENNKVLHKALAKPSKKVLLDYAVKDFDPARLYAVEIFIE